MKVSRVVMVSLGFSLVVLVALTMWMPSVDDLFVENPYWNGLSGFYVECDPIRLDVLSDWGSFLVPADNSTLFIIGPDSEFDVFDAEAVSDYLGSGGRVVLMDDFGSGNQLLELLGLDTRFTGLSLEDPLFYEGDFGFPVVLDVGLAGVDEVVLNLPTGLEGGGTVLASSSPFSHYVGVVDSGDLGSVPVIVRVSVGEGVLFVVSDSSVFINSMIDYRDNRALLGALARGRVFVDESHMMATRLTRAKGFYRGFYGFFDRFEYRYLFLGLVGVLVFKLKWETGEKIEEDDVVSQVMMAHPGWDRDLVEHVHRLRENDEG